MTDTVSEAVNEIIEKAEPLKHTFENYLHHGVLGVIGREKSVHSVWLIAAVLFCALLGYFLGSINWAVVISKVKYHDDIRKYGSGNAGATNMSRTYGKSAGIATLLGDILKTVIAVTIARFLCGDVLAYLCGMFCAFGHAFPIYYRFKGGKCVAVTAAMMLALEPIAFLIIFAIFVIIVAFTKYVSLGSVASALMLPLIVSNVCKIRYGVSDIRVVFVLVTCLLLIFMHRQNIVRLREGKENKLSFKKGSDDK